MLGDLKKYKLFFIITTLGLFFSFAFNAFGAVTTDSFLLNYKDSEALVANQVRCEGHLYADQLLELQVNKASKPPGCSEKELLPYSSQFGLQGKIYTVGFQLVSKIAPISSKVYVALAQLATAMISALVLGLLVLWVRTRIGKIPAVTTGVLIALSPMIVGFSRNLYWSLPLFILPLVYVLYFYGRDFSTRKTIIFWTGLGVILYLRYLCGYEYITTITIMAMAAVAYWLFIHKAKRIDFIKQIVLVGAISVVAFSAALATHVMSLNVYTGSTSKSLEIIKNRAQERTLNADKYKQYPYMNLEALAPDHYRVTNTYIDYQGRMESGSRLWAGIVAFSTYLLLPVVHLPISFSGVFGLYAQSMIVFVIMLVWLYKTRQKWVAKKISRQTTALFLAAAIGLVGYVSWLVFAYAHSLVHAHINGILMYLPFALFGYMIIGLFIEFLVAKFNKKYKR
jgi:ABC-type multidrug transport system fused ATPase/permease subunit